MKIVVGVVLLRTAWWYYDNTKIEKESYDEDYQTSERGVAPNLCRRSVSTDSNVYPMEDRSSSDKLRKTRKSKPLSDIERFTLCSNRII